VCGLDLATNLHKSTTQLHQQIVSIGNRFLVIYASKIVRKTLQVKWWKTKARFRARGWKPAARGSNAARVKIWHGPHQNFVTQIRTQHRVRTKLHDKQTRRAVSRCL